MLINRLMTKEISCCAECLLYARIYDDDLVCMHPRNEHVSVTENTVGNFHKDCPLAVSTYVADVAQA